MLAEGVAEASPGTYPVVAAIHEDEKAFRLAEWNLVRPPAYQLHRWQVVFVNRGGELAEWWEDLGPAKNFTAPPVNIPSLWEHTVAELRDIAERHRLMDDYWTKFLEEESQASTMIPDFLAHYEERWRIANNQSQFGPLISRQRNGTNRRKP